VGYFSPLLQGNFSLDDLVARGLLFSTDCSAMMLMEHKESEEIFTVREGSESRESKKIFVGM